MREYPWPEMSPDVRQRVMSAPVAAVESISWSDRVWFSRTWRLAAAALVVLVIVLDQAAGVSPSRVSASPQVMAEAKAVEDLALQAGLPADTAVWLGQRSMFVAPTPNATFELDSIGGM